jgi:hypothetical protein
MDVFMASWRTSLTEAPRPVPADSFLKSPPILLPQNYKGSAARNVSLDFSRPGDHMVPEAEIYEVLKKHPHPNICVYYDACVMETT